MQRLLSPGVIAVREQLKFSQGGSSLFTTDKLGHTEELQIQGKFYACDEWTNVTQRVLEAVGKNLHLQKDHPLCLIKDVIVKHFYGSYPGASHSPLFAVFDNLSPVVTTQQNFDSMLIPEDHVTRRRSDNYYINKKNLLRAHTSAHEHELLKAGLNAFLVVGDVYRRDTIDSTHYPVFHQLEGVRLFNKHQLFNKSEVDINELSLFEDGPCTEDKQGCHTMEAAKLVELNLKQSILNCVHELFGMQVEFKWVEAYFPFTHPSFELEIKVDGEWVEMLGCGVLRQEILKSAGVENKIAWAFGLGLERLAMKLFDIPDIRLFWSSDEGFLSQFRGVQNIKTVKFKPLISKQPALRNDISFWILEDTFCSNDFYDLVRSIDNDLIESVSLVDEFVHPQTKRRSHCYSIFYRHMSRPLTQAEVADLHQCIQKTVVKQFNVEGRW